MKLKLMLFALATMATASAFTSVQTQEFSFVPNDTTTLTFDKLLGSSYWGPGFALNSVTVYVTYTKSGGSYAIDNDSADSGTIDLNHTVVLSLSSADVSLIKTGGFTTSVGQTGSMTISDTLTGQSIGPTSGDPTDAFNAQPGHVDYLQFVPGSSLISDSGVINAATTSSYVASTPSTFNIDVNAIQTEGVTGLGGLQQSFTVSNVVGGVTVVYDFIPEPGAALLGGIGVLALFRRRR